MDPITFFRDLRACIARTLKTALKEVLKARGDPAASRAKALDIYASSGYLLRASSAFVGGLSDYIEQRSLLDDADHSVAGRKLRSSAEYFSDALDTFVTAVAAFVPDKVWDGSGHAAGDARFNGQLVRALYSGTPALDRYRVILEEARQNHEVLRQTVVDLRRQIKQTFGAKSAAPELS